MIEEGEVSAAALVIKWQCKMTLARKICQMYKPMTKDEVYISTRAFDLRLPYLEVFDYVYNNIGPITTLNKYSIFILLITYTSHETRQAILRTTKHNNASNSSVHSLLNSSDAVPSKTYFFRMLLTQMLATSLLQGMLSLIPRASRQDSISIMTTELFYPSVCAFEAFCYIPVYLLSSHEDKILTVCTTLVPLGIALFIIGQFFEEAFWVSGMVMSLLNSAMFLLPLVSFEHSSHDFKTQRIVLVTRAAAVMIVSVVSQLASSGIPTFIYLMILWLCVVIARRALRTPEQNIEFGHTLTTYISPVTDYVAYILFVSYILMYSMNHTISNFLFVEAININNETALLYGIILHHGMFFLGIMITYPSDHRLLALSILVFGSIIICILRIKMSNVLVITLFSLLEGVSISICTSLVTMYISRHHTARHVVIRQVNASFLGLTLPFLISLTVKPIDTCFLIAQCVYPFIFILLIIAKIIDYKYNSRHTSYDC